MSRPAPSRPFCRSVPTLPRTGIPGREGRDGVCCPRGRPWRREQILGEWDARPAHLCSVTSPFMYSTSQPQPKRGPGQRGTLYREESSQSLCVDFNIFAPKQTCVLIPLLHKCLEVPRTCRPRSRGFPPWGVCVAQTAGGDTRGAQACHWWSPLPRHVQSELKTVPGRAPASRPTTQSTIFPLHRLEKMKGTPSCSRERRRLRPRRLHPNPPFLQASWE